MPARISEWPRWCSGAIFFYQIFDFYKLIIPKERIYFLDMKQASVSLRYRDLLPLWPPAPCRLHGVLCTQSLRYVSKWLICVVKHLIFQKIHPIGYLGCTWVLDKCMVQTPPNFFWSGAERCGGSR